MSVKSQMSNRLDDTPLCHCETGEASRSNLVVGTGDCCASLAMIRRGRHFSRHEEIPFFFLSYAKDSSRSLPVPYYKSE